MLVLVSSAALFLLLAALATARHEMWRDELQAWMLARDSASLGQLFANLRYEGHPPLWHLVLFVLARVVETPVAMQVVHVAVAATTAILVLLRAPLPSWQRVLFVFGYFPFYEYCVKSRSYALGALLMVGFVALLDRPAPRCDGRRIGARAGDAGEGSGQRRGADRTIRGRVGGFRSVVLVALLSALSLTSVLGAGIAFVLFFLLWKVVLVESTVRIRAAVFAIFLLGLCLTFAAVRPPADGGYAVDLVLRFEPEHYAKVVSRITHAYLPTPDGVLYPRRSAGDLFVAHLLLLWGAWIFWRRPLALAFYLAATLGLLLFFYVRYLGLLWHHGHLYLVWFLALWLAAAEGRAKAGPADAIEADRGGRSHPARAGGATPGRSRWPERTRGGTVGAVLVTQVVTAIWAHVREWREPFSAAGAAAGVVSGFGLLDSGDRRTSGRFLSTPTASPDTEKGRYLLAGDLDFIASAVVGHLPKGTSMFYVAGERHGSFIRWDTARLERVTPGWDALRVAAEEGRTRGSNVLFVSSYDLGANLPPSVREVARVTRSLWPDERYYIYEVIVRSP